MKQIVTLLVFANWKKKKKDVKHRINCYKANWPRLTQSVEQFSVECQKWHVAVFHSSVLYLTIFQTIYLPFDAEPVTLPWDYRIILWSTSSLLVKKRLQTRRLLHGLYSSFNSSDRKYIFSVNLHSFNFGDRRFYTKQNKTKQNKKKLKYYFSFLIWKVSSLWP